MRREMNMNKRKNANVYVACAICIISLITIGMLYYNFSKPDNSKIDTSKLSQVNNTTENTLTDNNLEQASVNIGKTVEESEMEIEKENETKTEKIAINTSIMQNDKLEETENKEKTQVNEVEVEAQIVEEKEELVFAMPVDGEIIKEFANDTLLYSATLNEWTTHSGIDIKAEKTTVVKSSEKGTVKYIKNDPRYGLTVVIEHTDGYTTVYSNLLTSEFVVEGEQVEKGQTIGTVGNTAVFEIADESHLHFEILKDNIQVDPNMYIK